MWQILATSISCFIILGIDGIIATALLHTCGHFAVVKKNLEQLDSHINRVCIVFCIIIVFYIYIIHFEINCFR